MPTKQILNQTQLDDALLSAAENGETDKIKELISKGADTNTRNTFGNTPLMWAAYDGYIETAKFLIENGADINAQNKYGNTPLMQAVKCGHIEVAEFLITHGSDIHVKNNHGRTAEDIAVRRGYHKLADILKNIGRTKTLNDVNEQLKHQNRIHDALRRNDPLTMSNGEFLDMLEKNIKCRDNQ